MNNLNPQQFDSYRLAHRAPVEGVPIHQAADAFPDVIEHPEWYGNAKSPYTREAHASLVRSQGNPEGEVDVYRALPKEHSHINPGDWVTTSRSYAQMHAAGLPYHVLHARVPAEHVISDGNDIHEFGYGGPQVAGRRVG